MLKLPCLALILTAVAGSPALANVVGNDQQSFNPVAGSTDFVTVQSSLTLDPGRFNLGLFLDDAANALPFKNEKQGGYAHVNDSVVGMGLGAGVGLIPGLELGVAAPFVLKQSVDDGSTRGEYAQNGNTSVRAGLKYTLTRSRSFGLALVASATVDRTQDDPAAGTASNATTYNGEIAGDTHAGAATFGLNLGYRYREPGKRLEGSLVGPLGNELLASAAAGYKVTPDTSLMAEVYGDKPVASPANDSDRTPWGAEALLGVKHSFTKELTGHVGAGAGLDHGLATPSARLYTGIVMEMGPGGSPGRTTTANKRAKHPSAPAAAPSNAATPPKMAHDDMTNDQVMALIPTQAPDEVFVLHNINFEFDSDYRVLPGALTELQKLESHLAQHPGAKIVVEGHCDYFGTDSYNDDLSMRRARTVRRQMIRHNHLENDQIVAVGFGKRHPMTPDTSDYGRQQNRRVEIKIYFDTAHH